MSRKTLESASIDSYISKRSHALGNQCSRIATSPKRVSRDGGGAPTINKGRVRVDSEGKPRPDPSRAPSTENKRSGMVIRRAEVHGVRSDESQFGQRATSHDNPLYIRRFADDARGANEACQFKRDEWPLPTSTSAVPTSDQTSHMDRKEGQESNTQTYVFVEPSHHRDSEHNKHQDTLRASRHHQDQSLKPLHGILKENNNPTYSGTIKFYQDSIGHHYGVARGHPRDNPCFQNHQRASAGTSAEGSLDPLYQQPSKALSRSSRSTTPESAYSYGALPMRSTSGPHAQHLVYSNNAESLGSVPQKAESQYSMGSTERDHNYAVINYKNKTRGAADHTNKNYASFSCRYQPIRPDSVPLSYRDSHDSLYSAVRPGSVPPQHYSDSETAGSHRVPRAGSVPVGYETSSVTYGMVRAEHPRHENAGRNFETASDYVGGSSSSLRGGRGGKQAKTVSGRRPTARRHTVGASKKVDTEQETEKKREAFMQLLAQRYPQYADKIQGVEASTTSQPPQQERPSRSREGQRRRTAVVTYNPNQAANVLEYDDLGTMSDLELPSFQRGGFMRTSMPIVRSASTSLERPLGLVFLVYRDQTKKSMLPNEITTLDTVRALFVRAFPDLTLEMLENPRKKIYLLDPATNIYFQLEDLMDIKDRSVLKIHETDNDQPQKVKVRQEVRGRTVQMPAARSHSQQAYAELPIGHEVYGKAQSLPPQVAHSYPEMMQEQRNMWELERRSRSRTPELAERPRSLSAGAPSRQRFSHSPDRLPTPERVPLNPIPENRQMLPGYTDQGNYYETIGPGTYRGQYSSGIYDSAVPYQSYPPAPQIPPQQMYIARSTRAPSMAHPQRAVAPGPDLRDSTRGNNANRHSLAFAPMSVQQAAAAHDGGAQQSQNYHIPVQAERDGSELTCSATSADGVTRNRIEKMEQQLANLTAWVHCQKDGTRRESQSVGSTTSDGSDTLPASSASKNTGNGTPLLTLATLTDNVAQSQGLSDIHDGSSNQRSSGLSSRESTPINAQLDISAKLSQLKSDLHVLRRQQQLNMEAMRDEFLVAATKIKKILSTVPGTQNQLNFQKRNEATIARRNYLSDKNRVEKELSDLEASVEELRADVISRQCRVNTSDVEGMALLLSNITKSLADLKAHFPEIQNLMKNVMDAELRVVVSEEKFLKEEPTEIEHCLKRCKKITGTLYTLKRLASVQDHRPPHVPNMAATTEVSIPDQKQAVLDNIRALVPDHEQRVKEMEAADASRERKKKITSQQEALKFGKSLEKASKSLRPPSQTDIRGPVDEDEEKVDEGCRDDRGSQTDQVKPTISAKPAISSTSTAKHSSVSSTSVKPSFPSATTVKPLDKPTATVSAMTAAVSDTITMMATKTTERGSNPSTIIPNTQTIDCLAGGVAMGRSETHSIKVMTDSPRKKDAAVYAYQFSGQVNQVFPVSTSPFQLEHEKSSKSSEYKDNLHDVHIDQTKSSKGFAIPPDVALNVVTANNEGGTLPNTFSELPDGLEKDHVTQREALRSAFFSSLNTPPDSPSLTSPNRNSAGLELGPVLSPSHGGRCPQSTTINLALSGTAIPKSPHSPGSFAIAPPPDVNSGMATESKTAFSLQNSPARGIPRLVTETKTSHDPQLSSGADSGSKQKKVPPPPPPRKDSRPTSANISPVNGPNLDLSRDMPQFVGGILGQHRHSGGPLFSTPKPVPQPKPASRFEQDFASGIYANMNRPDIQSQKSSPQQIMSEANIPSKVNSKDASQSNIRDEIQSIPPPPSVTIALDREERGSSSESSSSSSSSGTSGSQQSVVSVIRSASTSDKGSSKSKPDPPKRQSSLLAKLTGFKESKSKVKNGNAKVNGVDL